MHKVSEKTIDIDSWQILTWKILMWIGDVSLGFSYWHYLTDIILLTLSYRHKHHQKDESSSINITILIIPCYSFPGGPHISRTALSNLVATCGFKCDERQLFNYEFIFELHWVPSFFTKVVTKITRLDTTVLNMGRRHKEI